MTLVEKAKSLAVRAHEGQVRKVDQSPYINHPLAVSSLVEEAQGSEVAVAAALVHDVLEDTPASESEMRAELGDEVTGVVKVLTEDKALPWEDRKQKYIDAVRAANMDVQLVSLADKVHNAQSTIEGYKEFGSDVWTKFNRGKDKKMWFEREMLAVFKEKLDNPFVAKYEALVEQMEALV